MDNAFSTILIVIVILVVVFLILREVNCWYWKINERISLQKEQNSILMKILKELNNEPKPKNKSTSQINEDVDNIESGELKNEFHSTDKSISQINELFDTIENMDINEQLKFLEGMDDNLPLKIRNIRNNELHETTVKEWIEFIKFGTYKAFKLVKE